MSNKKQQAPPPTPEERFESFLQTDDPEVAADKRNEQERRQRIHSFLGTEYAKLSSYVILTFVIIYAIKKMGDHLPEIFMFIGKWAGIVSGMLTPLIMGFVIAYLLYPLKQLFMKLLQRLPRYKKNPGRSGTAAVALTVVLALGLLVILLSFALSAVGRNMHMISLDDLTAFVTSLAASIQDLYVQVETWLQEASGSSAALSSVVDYLTDMLQSFTASLGSSLTGSLSNITGILGNALFAIIFAIYFLLDTEGLESYWDRVLHSLTSKRVYRGIHLFLEDADTVFSGYIRGQMLDAIIMFFMVSTALGILGIPYANLIGIMTGLGNLIPYVGPFIAYGSTIIICLITGDLQKLVIAVIILFIIQTVDGNVINPKLLSSNINVHPMLVIVALIIGGAAGGILGMLLGVPVAALIKIWFDRGIRMLNDRKKEKYAAEISAASKTTE